MEQRAPPLNGAMGGSVAKWQRGPQRRVAFFLQASQCAKLATPIPNFPSDLNTPDVTFVTKIAKCSMYPFCLDSQYGIVEKRDRMGI